MFKSPMRFTGAGYTTAHSPRLVFSFTLVSDDHGIFGSAFTILA